MTNNETILFNRLLAVLADLNNTLDAEAVELIFSDLCKVSGKTQNEIAKLLEEM